MSAGLRLHLGWAGVILTADQPDANRVELPGLAWVRFHPLSSASISEPFAFVYSST